MRKNRRYRGLPKEKPHRFKIAPSPYIGNTRLDGGLWRIAQHVWPHVDDGWKSRAQIIAGVGDIYSPISVVITLYRMRKDGLIDSGWGTKNGQPVRFYRRKTWLNIPELPWERRQREFDAHYAYLLATYVRAPLKPKPPRGKIGRPRKHPYPDRRLILDGIDRLLYKKPASLMKESRK